MSTIAHNAEAAEAYACHCADCLAWMDAEAQSEQAAEAAATRFYEEGTAQQHEQYVWEVEMDERNATFWSGAF